MKVNETVRLCNTHARYIIISVVKFSSESLNGRGFLRDIGVDG